MNLLAFLTNFYLFLDSLDLLLYVWGGIHHNWRCSDRSNDFFMILDFCSFLSKFNSGAQTSLYRGVVEPDAGVSYRFSQIKS